MDCSVITRPSSEGLLKIQAERDYISLQWEQERINDAWTHQYRMTDIQNQQLQACFPSRYVYPKNAYKDSSHPVLAALNDYCNEEASRLIANYNKQAICTLTIGDAVNRPLNASHNCLLMNNTRELYRVASNCTDPLLHRAAVYGTRAYACVNGSQNCDFRAKHGFAVHSIYDISISEMGDIFNRHGLETLTAYMYFTTRFYNHALMDPYEFF